MGFRKKTGDIDGLADRVRFEMDGKHQQYTSQVRAKWLDRWMEICGVDDPEKIDYDNPYVHLEWLLCDTRVTSKLPGGMLEEALAMMDEKQR